MAFVLDNLPLIIPGAVRLSAIRFENSLDLFQRSLLVVVSNIHQLGALIPPLKATDHVHVCLPV